MFVSQCICMSILFVMGNVEYSVFALVCLFQGGNASLEWSYSGNNHSFLAYLRH